MPSYADKDELRARGTARPSMENLVYKYEQIEKRAIRGRVHTESMKRKHFFPIQRL